MTWRVLTSKRALQAGGLLGILLVVALWPEATEVEVGRVTRGAMAVKVDAGGATRVHHRFIVAAPIAGTLQPVALPPGRGVVRGETVVARIAPAAAPPMSPAERREATAALATARAALATARDEEQAALTALEEARAELQREQESFDAARTTRQSLDARQNLVGSAEESLSVARYALAGVEAEFERARLRVPAPRSAQAASPVVEVTALVDGVVLQQLRPDESQVAPGDPLLEIGDPGHIRIVATLPSAAASRVEPGMRVEVEHWGGDTPLTGWVERVEAAGAANASTDGDGGAATVLIDFEDDRAAWRAMGEGFHVQVRIVVWEAEDAIRVPNEALFKVGEEWAAYVVQNGRARRTMVSVGERNETETEVRGGLSPGQEVVVRPPETLADNGRVAVRP